MSRSLPIDPQSGDPAKVKAEIPEPKWLFGRRLLALAIFAVLGPPIGALLLLSLILGYGRQMPGMDFLFGLAVASLASYWVAGIQAFLVGLGTVIFAWRTKSTAFWHPLLVTLLVHGLILILIAGRIAIWNEPASPHGSPYSVWLYFLLPLSLVASLICWFIARPLLKAR